MQYFKLKSVLRDSITGYRGVAVSRCMYKSSVDRYALQAPMNENGTIPEEQTFDVTQLTIVENGPEEPTFQHPKFQYDDRVTVRNIGLKGYVHAICQYINGCTRYAIASMAKDGDCVVYNWFSEGDLELTKGLFGKSEKQENKEDHYIPDRPKPGGPGLNQKFTTLKTKI